MEYEAFLFGLTDELEKSAKEDGGEPWHPTPDEKKSEKGEEDDDKKGKKKEKEKDDKEKKDDDDGEEKEASDMSDLEIAFFDGLLNELEKNAGWRNLPAGMKKKFIARAKTNIGATRTSAAKNLLAKGQTGSKAFRSARQGGSLRLGGIKGTDQATVGRDVTTRSRKIMGRHGLGKGKPVAGTHKIKGVGTRTVPVGMRTPAMKGGATPVKATAAKIPSRRTQEAGKVLDQGDANVQKKLKYKRMGLTPEGRRQSSPVRTTAAKIPARPPTPTSYYAGQAA